LDHYSQFGHLMYKTCLGRPEVEGTCTNGRGGCMRWGKWRGFATVDGPTKELKSQRGADVAPRDGECPD